MTTITIPVSNEQMEKLRELAGERGVAPEELLRDHVDEWLNDQLPSQCAEFRDPDMRQMRLEEGRAVPSARVIPYLIAPRDHVLGTLSTAKN